MAVIVTSPLLEKCQRLLEAAPVDEQRLDPPHDGEPRLFEIPRDAVLEVPISHPEYAWFAGLGLKWHALPAIANMLFEVGGVRYPAAPVSGWYLGTERG